MRYRDTNNIADQSVKDVYVKVSDVNNFILEKTRRGKRDAGKGPENKTK